MERTRAEIEALIPSLPLRKLGINGKDRLLRYDEASRMAYMVEDDGITYTGNFAPLREKEPSSDDPEKAAVKESSPDDAKGKNGKTSKKEKSPKPQKTKKEKPKKSDAPSEPVDYETKKKEGFAFYRCDCCRSNRNCYLVEHKEVAEAYRFRPRCAA